jgi:hypothetical protein
MAGFEVIAEIARDSARQAEKELIGGFDEELREGIPVDLWRALPDST